jgi:hypothetical protein
MTKLTQFFGTCVLTMTLFSVAVAGDIPTPPVAPPPPAECTANCPGTVQHQASDSSDDIVTAVDLLAVWLVASIQ